MYTCAIAHSVVGYTIRILLRRKMANLAIFYITSFAFMPLKPQERGRWSERLLTVKRDNEIGNKRGREKRRTIGKTRTRTLSDKKTTQTHLRPLHKHKARANTDVSDNVLVILRHLAQEEQGADILMVSGDAQGDPQISDRSFFPQSLPNTPTSHCDSIISEQTEFEREEQSV